MAFEGVDDDDLEHENEDDGDENRRKPHILKEPGACVCPGLICDAAKRRDTTCHKLFEAAFEGYGKPDYYARGVFVAFINQPSGCPIPTIVKQYCARVAALPVRIGSNARRFCMGCMLPNASQGLLFAYTMLVASHLTREPGIPYEQASKIQDPERALLAQLWETLGLSEALANDEDSLEDLMRYEPDE